MDIESAHLFNLLFYLFILILEPFPSFIYFIVLLSFFHSNVNASLSIAWFKQNSLEIYVFTLVEYVKLIQMDL